MDIESEDKVLGGLFKTPCDSYLRPTVTTCFSAGAYDKGVTYHHPFLFDFHITT